MAAKDNPFYIQPTNVYESLMAGQKSFDEAQTEQRQREIDAALKQVGAEVSRGGITDTALGQLFGLPRGAGVPALNAAAHLQAAKLAGQGVYGTPIYGTDEHGNTVLGAIGKQGQWHPINTGGTEITPGVKIISTPEAEIAIDSRSGRVIGGGRLGGKTPTSVAPQGQPQSQNLTAPQNLTPQGFVNWARANKIPPGTTVPLPDGSPVVVPQYEQAGQQAQTPQGVFPKNYIVPEAQKAQGAGQGKKMEDIGKATLAIKSTFTNLDQSEKQLDTLLNSPGLPRILGLTGMFPSIPGGKAASAQTMLNTLGSQLALDSLTAMRQSSPTGGAVGQVTEREYPILKARFGNLEQAQNINDFRKAAQELKNYMAELKQNIQDAYNIDYGGLQRPTTPYQPGYPR